MTANSGGLYPGLPAAPLALEACASLVKPVVGSLLCAAVPRGTAAVALLPVPLWPLVELSKTEAFQHHFARRHFLGKKTEKKKKFNSSYPCIDVQVVDGLVRNPR